MTDPAEFLKAKLDEEEAAAGTYLYPTTLLRLVKATRQVLELHWRGWDGRCEVCLSDRSGHPEMSLPDLWPCDTIKAVAAGWGWLERQETGDD